MIRPATAEFDELHDDGEFFQDVQPPREPKPPRHLRRRRFLKHKGRVEPPLPSLNIESGFYDKVLDCVKRKRASEGSRYSRRDENSGVTMSRSPTPTVSHPMPCLDRVMPKYMALACVHEGSAEHWRDDTIRALERSRAITPRPRSIPAAIPGPAVEIVEAPVGITVTMSGNRSFRVPPHHWLVLEPCQENDDTDNLGSTQEYSQIAGSTDGQGLRLAEAAGGGTIEEELRISGLLRPVAPDRVQIKGAEANFRRAARGNCALSLVHATLITRIVTGAAAESADSQDHRSGSSIGRNSPACSVIDDRHRAYSPTSRGSPISHARTQSPAPENPFDDWARRAYRLVYTEAANAATRKEAAEDGLEQPRRKDWGVPNDPVKAIPSAFRSSPKKLKLVKGYQALQEFIQYAYSRYGNPVRVWFKLDPQEHMKLGERQFLRGCENIHFTGNAAALWKFIDSDQSGSISLLELHPPSATLLAVFKQLVMPPGVDIRTCFRTLDANNSMRIPKGEFVQKLNELKFEGNAPKLFDLLDRKHMHFLSIEDLMFLEKWQPPPYIYTEPNYDGLCRLKEAFQEVKGNNHLYTWRKALDRDGTMRISWDEWRQACIELSKTTENSMVANHVPKTIEEIAGIWRSLDQDCSGWIALREWDQKAFEVVAEFKRWADRTHGGVVKAFRVLDGSANAKLSLGELKKSARGPDGVKGDLELLFDGLDVHNAWVLTENEVKFLDDWDIDWEDWQTTSCSAHEAVSRTSTNTGSMRNSKHRKAIHCNRSSCSFTNGVG